MLWWYWLFAAVYHHSRPRKLRHTNTVRDEYRIHNTYYYTYVRYVYRICIGVLYVYSVYVRLRVHILREKFTYLLFICVEGIVIRLYTFRGEHARKIHIFSSDTEHNVRNSNSYSTMGEWKFSIFQSMAATSPTLVDTVCAPSHADI